MFHIQCANSILVDQLLRLTPLTTECAIPLRVFLNLKEMYPGMQADLFATSLNKKLPIFMSPCPDQEAIEVDALRASWDQFQHVYLFPPTTLILKALTKWKYFEVRFATLVMPKYITRTWYS